MHRITGFVTASCLALGLGVSVAAQEAQPRPQPQGRAAEQTVTLIGCIEEGARPNAFALNVIEPPDADASDRPVGTAGLVAAGSQIDLIGAGPADFRGYAGQKVEVRGMVVPQAAQRGAAPAAPLGLNVRNIRVLSETCPDAPVGTTGTPEPTDPEPEPAPDPTPLPEPTPEPIPEPTPVPEPMPEPMPEPAPEPEPTPEPEPAADRTQPTVGQHQLGIAVASMLRGLINVNVQQVMATVALRDIVIDVSDVLNENQIQSLVQALDTNPQAAQNAERLTRELRGQDVLEPDERVVGVLEDRVYKLKGDPRAVPSGR
jgi:hypothetical protein